MRFATARLAVACALAAAGAPLAAQDYDAARVVRSVGKAELAAIVGSLGHQVMDEGEEGEVLVIAETPDGMTYLMIGAACEVGGVPGCQGILMQVRFDLPAGTTPETLAKANYEQSALNVWASFENKVLGFTRYHVLDYGVTMANIRENVNVLLGLTGEAYPVAAGEQ